MSSLLSSSNWHFEDTDVLPFFLVDHWDSVTALVQYFSFVQQEMQVDFLIDRRARKQYLCLCSVIYG